jgi:polar amino acid transport system permease protein
MSMSDTYDSNERSGSGSIAVSVNRSFRAGIPPKNPTKLAITVLAISFIVVASTWVVLHEVRRAAIDLQVQGILSNALLIVAGLVGLLILMPATGALKQARASRSALSSGNLIAARLATSKAENLAHIALGYTAAQALLLLVIEFFVANDMAVSRTFLLLPLIGENFPLILKAFWTNVYIFVVAEVLVLIWGLLVALARLAPGAAGRPVRMVATLYIDIFRGLPAIITIYLIGFGIPLSGLPIFKDLSQTSFAILALTLTSGAYVAEIYRAGIESIHPSQTSAARSLGLTYVQTLRYVIIPQGVRHIIPPLLNNFIGLQKDTALVNVIGTIDAFNQSIIISSNIFNLSPVTVVAILFIVITIPQARIVDRLIERDRRRMRGGIH